jgi:phage terminase large subunit-like protein
MSLTNSPDGATPRLRRVPDCHHNDAGLVAELAAAYGTKLDGWQRDALEVGCGVREQGLWSAPTVGINCARQNGKSLIAVVRALAGVLLFGEKTVVVSAHQQKTSRLLFQNVESYFANYSDLAKRVDKVTSALGREEIRLKSGAVIAFPARTRATMRGWSVDCYIADEAQLVSNDMWAAAKPAMAARRGSQTWMLGTAPSALGDADVFGRLRAAAIAGTDPSLGWLEFGADEGCNLDDPEQWRKANPGRVETEAILSERRELSPEDFAKERLNIWPTDQSEHVFGPLWVASAAKRRNNLEAVTAYGLDRSPDNLVVVCAAYRDFDNGAVHVEPVFIRDQMADMTEVVDWLTKHAKRTQPVVVDAASTASVAISPLAQAHRTLVVTTAQEISRACVGITDAVKSGRFSYADTDNADLGRAVDGARRRPVGEAGGYAWDRRDGSVAVSPLVSASLAYYGAVAHGRRRKPPRQRMVRVLN